MLRKFKVEIELCGPAHSTPEDVSGFLDSLKANKDVSDDADMFAFGDHDIYDEGKISLNEWNGEEVSAIASEE